MVAVTMEHNLKFFTNKNAIERNGNLKWFAWTAFFFFQKKFKSIFQTLPNSKKYFVKLTNYKVKLNMSISEFYSIVQQWQMWLWGETAENPKTTQWPKLIQ